MNADNSPTPDAGSSPSVGSGEASAESLAKKVARLEKQLAEKNAQTAGLYRELRESVGRFEEKLAGAKRKLREEGEREAKELRTALARVQQRNREIVRLELRKHEFLQQQSERTREIALLTRLLHQASAGPWEKAREKNSLLWRAGGMIYRHTAAAKHQERLQRWISIIESSGLFDAEWYLERYPDVRRFEGGAGAHYAQLGARLRRDPGPAFSTKQYLADHPELKPHRTNPLVHYATRPDASLPLAPYPLRDTAPVPAPPAFVATDAEWIREVSRIRKKGTNGGPSASPTGTRLLAADRIRKRLWGGYSRYAVAELEALAANPQETTEERVAAFWHLAVWNYFNRNFESVRQLITAAYIVDPTPNQGFLNVEIQCALRMGHFDEAARRVDYALENVGKFTDFLLLRSTVERHLALARGESTAEAEQIQLYHLNEIFRRAGLAELELKDPSKPLDFSNIAAHPAKLSSPERPLVSVIIPAFNAEDTIQIAIDSLLAQSHSRLEVIVVDDLSTDNTAQVAESCAARDSRVTVIRKAVNEGAYLSRNRGLQVASGDYVMVHDSDDWSHPQKIEELLAKLSRHAGCVAVMGFWVRLNEKLEVVGPWRPKKTLPDLDFSSLLIPREVVERIGGWDSVRVGGDAEFYYRFLATYGLKSICKVKTILSLSLLRENSLTQTKATHVRSLDFGLRWQYRDAYNYFHTRLKADERTPGNYPLGPLVPVGNRTAARPAAPYDLVVLADFANNDHSTRIALDLIEMGSKAGSRIGAVHWRAYEGDPQTPLAPRIYELALAHDIDLLTYGDGGTAKAGIVLGAALLAHQPDALPPIRYGKLNVFDESGAEMSDEVLTQWQNVFGCALEFLTSLVALRNAFPYASEIAATSSVSSIASEAGTDDELAEEE